MYEHVLLSKRGRFSRAVAGAGLIALLYTGHSADASESTRQYEKYFTGHTLRFDYFHSGTASSEAVSPDQLRLEADWPGSKTKLLDSTNLGKYLFEVVDAATNRTLYSRGFASIYGEWETTGEALEGSWRTYHESLRFPEPRAEFQLTIKKRAKDGSFSEIYSSRFDPASRFVDRSPLERTGTVWPVFENGPPAVKVDLLVLGEGYSSAEQDKFRGDVARLTGVLFDTEPFRRRKQSFNVRAVSLVSQESGIDDPRRQTWRSSILGLSYNAFDSDRYVLSFENKRIREIAANAPYDALMVLFNARKYGGGGIFNLWATCASDTEPAPYVFVHEFGHSFAGLGDEYYSSQVAYETFNEPGTEPWEANITALLDPSRLKWRHLVEPSTPVPTPWDNKSFDEVSLAYQERRQKISERNEGDNAMEQLFREVKKATEAALKKNQYFGKIGAFEGASYQARGLYRPSVDCIMFSRNPTTFCAVCEEAIVRVIDLYSEQP